MSFDTRNLGFHMQNRSLNRRTSLSGAVAVLVALSACGDRITAPTPRITTDSASYTATPIGNGRVALRVITRYENPTDAPIELEACGRTPIYYSRIVAPAIDENPYSVAWGCGGGPPVVLEAHSMRTDTLRLTAPNSYIGNTPLGLDGMAGKFQVGFGDRASNTFSIKLPPGFVP